MYLHVEEAGTELAKQMSVVNSHIANAGSCAKEKGSQLLLAEKGLADLVDDVNSDMDQMDKIRMQEDTNLGRAESTKLVKDSYRYQFIVWTIIAVILFGYGIFGISSGNFNSPMHIAMLVDVVIIFIILRRVYLSGIL